MSLAQISDTSDLSISQANLIVLNPDADRASRTLIPLNFSPKKNADLLKNVPCCYFNIFANVLITKTVISRLKIYTILIHSFYLNWIVKYFFLLNLLRFQHCHLLCENPGFPFQKVSIAIFFNKLLMVSVLMQLLRVLPFELFWFLR